MADEPPRRPRYADFHEPLGCLLWAFWGMSWLVTNWPRP
jgi:hypothetical protein